MVDFELRFHDFLVIVVMTESALAAVEVASQAARPLGGVRGGATAEPGEALAFQPRGPLFCHFLALFFDRKTGASKRSAFAVNFGILL